MDDFRPPHRPVAHHEPQAVPYPRQQHTADGTSMHASAAKTVTLSIHLGRPKFKRSRRLFNAVFTAKRRRNIRRFFASTKVRIGLVVVVLVLLASIIFPVIQPYITQHTYELGSADALLQAKDPLLGSKLVHDAKNAEFDFNAGYDPNTDSDVAGGGGPKISAKAYEDDTKGLTVTDPVNTQDFTIKPTFKTWDGKQDGNRLVYPLMDGTGWMVYTMQASGVKEDILLRHANGDKMVLNYNLGLGDNYAAKVENDGSIGIYGSDSVLSGNVSTGSANDAKLLANARKKAPKTKLLFSLPTPVAYGAAKTAPGVKVSYRLDGSNLQTIVTGLKKARYPITIDPAVTVTSTGDLFRDTTPESNVDFNATTGNISRGAVTGGVIPSWTTNANSLGTARFIGGGTIYDDYAYVGGGTDNSGNNFTSVEFAHLSSANPSIGAWTTTTSLPVALSHFYMVAYDGYMYVIGGATTTSDCNTVTSAIYYNRIQTNGQLSSSWTTNSNSLPSAVCDMSAAPYNGKLYVTGGRTSKNQTSGVTSTEYATIQPDGSIGTFTSSSVVLPANRYGHDMRIYNGYVYLIGGSIGNGANTTNTVIYDALASDGSFYGSGSGNWLSASSFTTARGNSGSTYTLSYDGFMYIIGGCQTYASTQTCSSQLSDIQIAQINADGTLGPWSTDAQAVLPTALVGATVVSWRGNIYRFGGCSSMSGGSVTCVDNTTHLFNTVAYSAISSAGQVGPLNTPANALPTAVYAHGAVINNGYIYVVGGCVTVNALNTACKTGTNDTTGNTMRATLNADGTIGSWTTDSTHQLNGVTGLADFGLTVYNNYLYATGGYTYGGAKSNIWYIHLNTDGSLDTGGWLTNANSLGASLVGLSAIAYHGYLMTFGGCSNTTNSFGCTSGGAVTTVYTGQINTSTGAVGSVTTTTAMSSAKALAAAAVYNGYIYVAGGGFASGTTITNTIIYAQLSTSGTITGSWSTATGTLVHNLQRADAYVMNGYLYVTGGYDGTTIYGTVEIGKITMSGGNIGSNLTDSVTTFTARWSERTVFSSGYMYMTGGCTAGAPPASCSARSTLDEYVENYNAGNKNTSSWTNGANTYTTNRVGLGSVANNGYIYIAGGCTTFAVTNFNGGCSAENNTTYFATINPDGSLGTWATNATYNLPTATAGGCMVSTGGYLYYIGGQQSGTANNKVYYSLIAANGTPGAWSTSATNLTTKRSWMGCDVFNNYIYVAGGIDDTSAVSATVYRSPSMAAGGDITSWTALTSFTTARENLNAVAAGGYLYVMGGDDKTNAMLDVQYIQLNPSTGNTTGSWAYATDLPQPVSNQGSFAANGYIYLIGGRTAAGTGISTTIVAPINSTGTLGAWSTSANNMAATRFGAGTSFYNGYYYISGGHNGSAIISTSVIQQGGERSQSMRAQFSKYADLNGNGQPEKLVIYLTNAQNNSVDIEQWKMTYVSSREAANSWGTVTTISPLLNQNAYNVTALDGSAVNQVVARWYWLTFSINMEQSFTFTDDTQPTIFQYGLHYAPPPSKRLMHGRDFRDQNQQGDDLKLGI